MYINLRILITPIQVWNPHEEKAKVMADFGDDQYLDMICVEPGLLTDVPLLEGGKKASFTQTVKCVKD